MTASSGTGGTKAALTVGVAAACVVTMVVWGGGTAFSALLAVGAAILLIRSPGTFALLSWLLFAMVPEFQGDLELAPLLSVQTYRSVAGPVDLADITLGLAFLATLFVCPTAPLEIWRRHRRLVLSYGAFLLVVATSMVANAQVMRVLPLKPITYLPVSVVIGFGVAATASVSSWVIPVIFAAAGANVALGLVNAVAGTGREFAGLHLAFYDRASVFLIVVALLVMLQAAIQGVREFAGGARGWLWALFATLGLGTVALSLRRAMWLALGIGVAILLGRAVRRERRRALAVGAALVVALGAMTAVVLAQTGYLRTLVIHTESLVATLHGSGEEVSIGTRLLEEVDAFRSARRSPILGGGPAAEYQPSFLYGRGLDPSYVHNNYMWLFLHYGLLGVGTYLVFLWQLVASLARGSPADGRAPLAQSFRLGVLAALVGLLAALTGDSFLTAAHRWPPLLGFLIGAALALPLGQISTGSKAGQSGASLIQSTSGEPG